MSEHTGSEWLDCKLIEDPNKIVYAYDLFGNLTFLNKAGELISGYSAQEAHRMNIAQMVSPAFPVHEQVSHMLRGRLGLVFEIDLIAKDGRRVALEVSARLVRRGGLPIEIQGIAMPSVLRSVPETQQTPQCLREDFDLDSFRQL